MPALGHAANRLIDPALLAGLRLDRAPGTKQSRTDAARPPLPDSAPTRAPGLAAPPLPALIFLAARALLLPG